MKLISVFYSATVSFTSSVSWKEELSTDSDSSELVESTVSTVSAVSTASSSVTAPLSPFRRARICFQIAFADWSFSSRVYLLSTTPFMISDAAS